MKLDLATLIAAITMAASALALPILFVGLRAKVHQGLTLWGVGLVLNALSYPAFGLRALGWTATSILLSNLLTGLTLVLHTQAVAAFQRGRTRPLAVWVLWLLLALNVLAAAMFLQDDHLRNVLVALLQGAMAFMLLREAWGPGLAENRLTGRLVLMGGTGLLFAMLAGRTVLMLQASDWNSGFNVPGQVQVFTYFITLAVLLINTVGFVLMQMEHAIAQQRALATRDALTGVHNRTALKDFLAMHGAQSRRQNEPLAFLMLDIDHFKLVNDEHGHLAGDHVLREVAHRIQQRMRQSDILTRYGGEEFLAILPFTDRDGAVRMAQEIRQSMESSPIQVDNRSVPITISIGVHAGIPGEGDKDLEVMINLSDKALYVAKNTGRNRVEYL